MGWIAKLRSLPLWRQVVYVLAVVGAVVLLVWDIADEHAHYTTVAFFVLIAIATVALRTGPLIAAHVARTKGSGSCRRQ